MPIIYNPEESTWTAQDLTNEEKDSLYQVAANRIVQLMGAGAAKLILEMAEKQLHIEAELFNKEDGEKPTLN